MIVYIHGMGCNRRLLDTKKLIGYFEENGCIVTNDAFVADYLVLVTCAFNKERTEECLDLVEKLGRYPGELIVVGCLPVTARTEFGKKFNGKTVVTKDLDEIEKLFPDFRVKFRHLPDANTTFSSRLFKVTLKKRIHHSCCISLVVEGFMLWCLTHLLVRKWQSTIILLISI